MDRETFQAFYAETASALRAYLRLACRHWALADDLLQETYLRLLRRRLPELNDAQRKAYLYRTARSVLADHHRVRRREARRIDEYVAQGGTEPAELDQMVRLEERSVMDCRELPVDMQRVFDTLKPRQQALLWLAYVEGFKHDEIAEAMSVSSSSIRVLLSRARAELAAKLTDRGLGPDARSDRRVR